MPEKARKLPFWRQEISPEWAAALMHQTPDPAAKPLISNSQLQQEWSEHTLLVKITSRLYLGSAGAAPCLESSPVVLKLRGGWMQYCCWHILTSSAACGAGSFYCLLARTKRQPTKLVSEYPESPNTHIVVDYLKVWPMQFSRDELM